MRLPLRSAVAGVAVLAVLTPTAAQAKLYPGPNGLRDVRGAIEQTWLQLGGSRSAVGNPLTSEVATSPKYGAFNHFERGSIYWSPATGAREVRGAIRAVWQGAGSENGYLGFPATNERRTPNGRGAFNHFQGGSLYWSPGTGVHGIRGAIFAKWGEQGWEGGRLGFPTTDEIATPGRVGAFNHFEGGSIYWSPSTGAQEVRGAIRALWISRGSETGTLGFPTSSEKPTPDGIGRFNHFEGGSIYHHPATGTHSLTNGPIRNLWASMGWERGALGYPTSSEQTAADGVGKVQRFQRGSIYWSSATGAHEVRGAIHATYLAMGGENSPLGYPTSDEYGITGGRQSDFQHGSLVWTPSDGVAADVLLSGSGNATVSIPAGTMIAEVTNSSSSGDFLVETLVPGAADTTFVASANAAWAGQAPVNWELRDDTQLRVTAPGAWTIQLRPLSAIPTLNPGDVISSGPTGGSWLFRYTGPEATFTVQDDTYPGIFDVYEYAPDTTYLGNPVTNWEQDADGPATINGDSLLEIYSEGAWTITVP